MLNKQQQAELIRQWKAGDHSAREKLVEALLPLITTIASRATEDEEEREAVVSDAVMAICRAMDQFDLDAGTKFSTYAYRWIQPAIVRSLRDQRRAIYVPHGWFSSDPPEISQTHFAQSVLSEASHADMDRCQPDTIIGQGEVDHVDELSDKLECEDLLAVMNDISEEYGNILRWRWIDGEYFNEIGKRLGKSDEYARRKYGLARIDYFSRLISRYESRQKRRYSDDRAEKIASLRESLAAAQQEVEVWRQT